MQCLYQPGIEKTFAQTAISTVLWEIHKGYNLSKSNEIESRYYLAKVKVIHVNNTKKYLILNIFYNTGTSVSKVQVKGNQKKIITK